MRALLLTLALMTAPVALFFGLRTATGDPLSAIVLVLMLLVTFGGWIAGRPAAGAPMRF